MVRESPGLVHLLPVGLAGGLNHRTLRLLVFPLLAPEASRRLAEDFADGAGGALRFLGLAPRVVRDQGR